MNLYVITHRKTRKPAQLSISPNVDEADFCNDTSVRIGDWGEALAVYTEEKVADNILSRSENTGWYNSSIENPQWGHGFKPSEYEVVAVSL